jgi:hypothetical protein
MTREGRGMNQPYPVTMLGNKGRETQKNLIQVSSSEQNFETRSS